MTNPPKTPPLWIYSAVRAPYKPPTKIKKSLFGICLQKIANLTFKATQKRRKNTNQRTKKSDDD